MAFIMRTEYKKGLQHCCNPFLLLEAASGFEPLNKGFADLSHLFQAVSTRPAMLT